MEDKDPAKLIKKAQKYIEPGFFKAAFTDVNDRLEKAIDCYKEAAEIYKLNKEWSKAGDCYIEVAKLNEGLKEDPCEAYDNAILCFNKDGNKEKYEKIIDKLIKINVGNGRFAQAGELTFEKAQKLSEKNQKNLKDILDLYDQSLDFFQMDKNSNKNTVNKINEAKADLITLNGVKDDIDQAKYIYEEIAKNLSKTPNGKIFCKDYYAKIILLLLAYDDYITAKAYLDKYYDEEGGLYGTDIANFLENLIACMENNGNDIKDESSGGESKVMNFDIAVQMYKKKIRNNPKIWDSWKENIVNKIGDKISKMKKEKEEEFDEDDYR